MHSTSTLTSLIAFTSTALALPALSVLPALSALSSFPAPTITLDALPDPFAHSSTNPVTTLTALTTSSIPSSFPFPPNSGALAGKPISIVSFPFGFGFLAINKTQSFPITLDTPFHCGANPADKCQIGDLVIDVCSNKDIAQAQFAQIQCRTFSQARPEGFIAFNSTAATPFVVAGTGNTKLLEVLECRVMPEGQNVITPLKGVQFLTVSGNGFCSDESKQGATGNTTATASGSQSSSAATQTGGSATTTRGR
jgi:hypothetical protein